MTLGTAVLLLAIAVVGIVLARKYLCERRALRVVCLVLLSLLVLFCVGYIGLTVFFVNAVNQQPPSL